MNELEDVDRMFRDHELRAVPVIARGNATVTRPVLAIMMGGAVVALLLLFFGRHAFLSLAALFGGIAVAWVVHSFLVKRWWRWAIMQGVNDAILVDAAVEAKLLWPPDSFLGRREAATWRQVGTSNVKEGEQSHAQIT